MINDDDLAPYIIKQGEHLLRLAHALGFDAQQVWTHARNETLRNARGDGSILYPGDVIFIPKKRAPRELSFRVKSTNRFVARVPQLRLAVAFQNADGSAIINEPYEIDGQSSGPELTTDANGCATLKLPVLARQAIVTFRRKNLRFCIRVGEMDPHTEETGVWKRLQNLGFLDDGTAEELSVGSRDRTDLAILAEAVRKFQQANALEPTGEVCEKTRKLLVERHGQ